MLEVAMANKAGNTNGFPGLSYENPRISLEVSPAIGATTLCKLLQIITSAKNITFILLQMSNSVDNIPPSLKLPHVAISTCAAESPWEILASALIVLDIHFYVQLVLGRGWGGGGGGGGWLIIKQ